jgi:hypothetical protein
LTLVTTNSQPLLSVVLVTPGSYAWRPDQA